MEKCFAETGNYCKALKERQCEGCNFYRTRKEVEFSRDRAIKRIDSLPKTTRMYIYDKYFKGE